MSESAGLYERELRRVDRGAGRPKAALIQHSPAEEPRGGWVGTVVRSWTEAEGLMEESPSLRAKPGVLLQRANRAATEIVAAFTVEQVLGDRFPDRQPASADTPPRRHRRGSPVAEGNAPCRPAL